MKELQLVNSEVDLMLPEETKEQMRSILMSGISKNTLKSTDMEGFHCMQVMNSQ